MSTSLAEVLDAHGRTLMGEIHTGLPAKVTLYNPVTNLLACEVAVKAPFFLADGDREYHALPRLVNVPVMWPRFGGKVVRGMLEPGDWVWLAFSEASLAEWRTTGQVSEPVDARRLSIGYPYAILGAFPDASPMSPLDAAEVAAGALLIGEDGGLKRLSVGGSLATRGDHVLTVEAFVVIMHNMLFGLGAAGLPAAWVASGVIQGIINAALAASAVSAPATAPAQVAAAPAIASTMLSAVGNTSAPYTAAIEAAMAAKTPNESKLFPSIGSADVRTG